MQKKDKNSKKKFSSILRNNFSEAAKTLNLSLKELERFNCATFRSQLDLPLMSKLKKKTKQFKVIKEKKF